jgi:hypothetical protein
MSRTASKSPGEAMGKPASMTSTPEPRELQGDLELLLRVERDARRLLAVAQGGVEDVDAVGVGLWDGRAHGFVLRSEDFAGHSLDVARGFRRPPRTECFP